MSLLFESIQFGQLELKNRIVIAPMCQYSATEQGEVTYWHEQQWANYALSGPVCVWLRQQLYSQKGVLVMLT